MTVSTNFGRAMTLSFALLFSSFGFLNSAHADDREGSSERPVFSANVALTTDYVFRGITQTDEHAAIQGGFDATYKMFYAGVWASNLDFGGDGNGNDIADIEIDIYAGLKHTFGNVEADLGVIYYAYPSAEDAGAELDYIEIKFGLSGQVAERVNLGATVFYSPEYTGETGDVWTYEGTVGFALGTYGRFSPNFSALIGYSDFQDNSASSYTYWNAGVDVGLWDKFTLDLRYWDTDINDTIAEGVADERFVATLSASF